jgi:maltooligosyltrehalose trehalohydrolase
MLLKADQLKAIAAILLLSPFVPMLFQGEEWGASTPFQYFTDHNEELGRLVAEGRAREFSAFKWQGEVPNPQDPDTFLRSKLNWRELSEPQHAQLLDWHRQLIHLRQSMNRSNAKPVKPVVKYNAERNWLTYVHGPLLAVFNFAAVPQRIVLPAGAWQLTLASCNVTADAQAVPGGATLVYKKRADGEHGR